MEPRRKTEFRHTASCINCVANVVTRATIRWRCRKSAVLRRPRWIASGLVGWQAPWPRLEMRPQFGKRAIGLILFTSPPFCGRKWRDPRLQDQWNAVGASPLEGVGATTSARRADQRDQCVSQESTPEAKPDYAAQVCAGRGRELSAWSKFAVLKPANLGFSRKRRRTLGRSSRGRWWMASEM